MKGQVSTKPPAGMRDFLPAEIARRRYVIDRIQEVYESYGFAPIETPCIENLSTLLGKYGEEGEGLIYRLLHRRDKLQRALAAEGVTESDLASEGLRYDLTVPLARFVAAHRGEVPRYFKRYQIQPVWRADRPGRGRFREFYQCDLDVAGTDSVLADVEVLSAGAAVLERLGFDRFEFRLNHRGLLRSLIRTAGIPLDLEQSSLVALDKLDKIGRDGVLEELARRGVGRPEAGKLLEFCCPGIDSNQGRLDAVVESLDDEGRSAVARLQEILDVASAGPASSHLVVDPALARGLGYYTGAIFEVTVEDLQGSLGGGGRYDGLVGMFSGTDIPAVGFSLGLERVLVVMEERDMFPELSSGVEILVCGFPDVPRVELVRVAELLRRRGHRVDLHPDPTRKLGMQLRYANEVGAREAAIVGMAEVEKGVVKIKDLTSGDQREEPLEEAGSSPPE